MTNTGLTALGVSTLNWGNQTLITSSSNVSVDWGGFGLHDSSTNLSVDWSARLMYNTSGGGTTVDWLNGILYENGGGTDSVKWANRQLIAGGGSTLAVDWGNRQLVAADGTTVVLDWNSTTPIFHGQFADNETPSGAINGSNVTFTLANSPTPDVSLQLIYNGQFQLFGTDYTLSGNTITFATAPFAGTWIRAYYRF